MSITITIFLALGISFGINMIFFLIAFILKSDLFTDITYASTFLITSIIMMVINNSYNIISFIILALVIIWSIRLGSYLMIRIIKTKVDHRFDNMRNSFWKFGLFWVLQALTVWIVNMPSFIIFSLKENEFNYLTIILIIAALFFLFFETIADIQKWNWIQNNPGKFINKGLWKISRHPNYFGEYMFWWMIFGIILLNNYDNIKWIGIISPLFITFTLYKLSGLPLIEKQSFKLFGHQKEYIEYLNKTPAVIPFIGKKGYNKKKFK